MTKPKDWNATIIKEFRANQGVVGGHFEGASLLLLHNKGAKSGKVRVSPMMYLEVDQGYLVIASKGGADTHPDWYYNILSHPRVTVELGKEQFEANARVTQEPERTDLFNQMVAVYPGFGDYEKKTERIIPAIVISRK